jgi:hypothetical protein
MKNMLRCAVGIFCAIAFMYGAGKLDHAVVVHAQAVTALSPYSFQVTGTLANCPAVASGTTQFCFTTTGLYQSISGAAWALAGGATSVALTLNGTTKTLPASFTISAAAPTVSATAPGVSAQ